MQAVRFLTAFIILFSFFLVSCKSGVGGKSAPSVVKPELSIDDVTIGEAGTATFTVSLDKISAVDINFDWATSDVNASGGTDYTSVGTTTETITAGNISITVDVITLTDSLDELDETFQVSLSNEVEATILDATGVGTITDDDNPPSISIDDVSRDESGSATFTVSLSAASGLNVSFDWATSDVNTTADTDYTSVSTTTETITAGNTSTTVSVTLLNDSDVEVDETYQVDLSNEVNATISDATGVGTIEDNDTPSSSDDFDRANETLSSGANWEHHNYFESLDPNFNNSIIDSNRVYTDTSGDWAGALYSPITNFTDGFVEFVIYAGGMSTANYVSIYLRQTSNDASASYYACNYFTWSSTTYVSIDRVGSEAFTQSLGAFAIDLDSGFHTIGCGIKAGVIYLYVDNETPKTYVLESHANETTQIPQGQVGFTNSYYNLDNFAIYDNKP